MAVSVFAADTTVMLEVGPNIEKLTDSERVDIAKSGTYTISVESANPIDGISSSTFMSLKTVSGNTSQVTALPKGTTITLKSVKLGGTEVAVKPENATYTVNGTLDFMFKFQEYGYNVNIFDGELPNGFTTVEVVIEVVNPESPADEPAETTPADTTPADTTPADTTPADTTPADTTPAAPTTAPSTGLALAVVPAIIALGAVAVSKKH